MQKTPSTMLIIITATFCTQAGEIHWLTNFGMESRTDCVINQHSHNDNSQTHEYLIDCSENRVTPIQTGSIIGNSTIYFDGAPMLTCKMEVSILGRNDVFFMLLDCT